MMGVGVQGRLLQASRMQGCESRGDGRRKKKKRKQKDDMTGHMGRREKRPVS